MPGQSHPAGRHNQKAEARRAGGCKRQRQGRRFPVPLLLLDHGGNIRHRRKTRDLRQLLLCLVHVGGVVHQVQILLHVDSRFLIVALLHQNHAQHIFQLEDRMLFVSSNSLARTFLGDFHVLQEVIPYRIEDPGIGKVHRIEGQQKPSWVVNFRGARDQERCRR